MLFLTELPFLCYIVTSEKFQFRRSGPTVAGNSRGVTYKTVHVTSAIRAYSLVQDLPNGLAKPSKYAIPLRRESSRAALNQKLTTRSHKQPSSSVVNGFQGEEGCVSKRNIARGWQSLKPNGLIRSDFGPVNLAKKYL